MPAINGQLPAPERYDGCSWAQVALNQWTHWNSGNRRAVWEHQRLSAISLSHPLRKWHMKLTAIALATAFMLSGPIAFAQSSPGGPGTPRPAAKSASSKHDTTGMAPNKSGSGTSTSGGRDDNGDQGRDAMSNSSQSVMPLDKQHKPEK
jgi:hypothetical protein